MSSSPETPGKLLYTSEEARIALGISARKLRGMTASGEIPHIRLGRSMRYPVADLLRWIERKKGGTHDVPQR